ncbi:class I SAM-dependent methyltransferase [Streptomyces sp. NPDC002537]
MTAQVEFEVTEAEREVADLLPLRIPPDRCRQVLASTPMWFHTFALNKDEGIYTPGLVRDHRYRIPFLPKDLTGKRVIDVGTCDGFYAFLAEARGAETVLGVDNEQHTRLVKERFGVDIPGGQAFRTIAALLDSKVEYLKADAFDLAGWPQKFDFAFCCGLLHRVKDPLGMLHTVRGLLEPGGTMLLETYGTPDRDDASSIRVLSAGEANKGDNVHYWGFSKSSIRRLAEWASFEETGDTALHVVDGHPRVIATLRAL